MKKLILLFVIVTSVSCSGDDDNKGCKCDAVFYMGQGAEPFVAKNMELDCKTGKPKYNPTGSPNSYFLNCQK